jgi:hypothetical protein
MSFECQETGCNEDRILEHTFDLNSEEEVEGSGYVVTAHQGVQTALTNISGDIQKYNIHKRFGTDETKISVCITSQVESGDMSAYGYVTKMLYLATLPVVHYR